MSIFSAHHPVRQALFPALLAGAALSCLVSCSKPAPETPMERSRALLRLFGSLDRRDNEEALGSIETYRDLDPTNLFLTDFEHIVRANGVLTSAKAKLDAGDFAGAAADLDAYYLKYGSKVSEPVTAAKKNVDLLLEAQHLNDKLRDAQFSDDIRSAATDLGTFAKANSGLFPKLSAYADAKIREADALAVVENADASVALFQDALNAGEEARKAEAAGRKAEARTSKAEAAALTALLELNADPEQRAGFEAWLLRNAPANP